MSVELTQELIEALESYSSHLEASFLRIKLPQVGADGNVPPTFDMSPAYINSIDNEFTRVYEEYNRRVSLVQQLGQEMVSLWAELGTPQAQTDTAIVKQWRDSPEQLGLHQDDLRAMQGKRDKLVEEKRQREKRIKELRSQVEVLWDRLGIDDQQRKAFLSSNRGCGLRAINDLEDQLSQLNELKRQNLHLFVEDARTQLQTLWDQLYFSEEEAVEFTPMFCDVFSDALLSAHEAEIAKLQALKEQRLPTLQMIDKHRSLIKDREDLAASSQDASRLMSKGNKGEKRDPTRLLREEKMRKRIAKDLPKLESELVKELERWEDEYGRPFSVFGERYLDVLEECVVKAPPPRSKTPNAMTVSRAAKTPATAQTVRVASRIEPPSTMRSKPPAKTAGGREGARHATLAKSPSKIPARVSLGNHNGNSPQRTKNYNVGKNQEHPSPNKMGLAPPPKMRNLFQEAPTPGIYHADVLQASRIVRQHEPDDPYREGFERPRNGQGRPMGPPARQMTALDRSYAASVVSSVPSLVTDSSRQPSGSSSVNGTALAGSENWEIFGNSDDEPEHEHVDHSTANSYFGRPAPVKRAFDAMGGPPLAKTNASRGPKARMIEGLDGLREASWETEDMY